MNTFSHTTLVRSIRSCATLAALVGSSLFAGDTGTPALLDDFSNAEHTSGGAGRLLVDDAGLGSQSKGSFSCEGGIVAVKGSLTPGRGVPAFMSFVLLASPDGQPLDLSAFEGVRMRIKINAGSLSVQAGSSEVTNFDYHSGTISAKAGAFQDVRVSFKDMKRAWSEQTTLNLKTITSINLVAFGMAKGEFSYEVDEIGFY